MEVTGEVSVDGPAWMNAGSVMVSSGGILNLNAETFRGDSFTATTDGTFSYLASGKIFLNFGVHCCSFYPTDFNMSSESVQTERF